MLFEELIVHDYHAPVSAAMNMAIDEALLEQATLPALRFYGWRQPSLSFGYFNKFAEIAGEADDRELVRRWTGGGTVPHGEDLTYSLVTPATEAAAALGSSAIYAALHAAIRDALREEGKTAHLAPEAAPKISEACFANPVRNDVLLDERKIAGAAQRRTRGGFLHQGSIQLPDLPDSFRTRFVAALARKIRHEKLPPQILARAAILEAEKYGTATWLRRW
jgi:lipoate-protein ligase A